MDDDEGEDDITLPDDLPEPRRSQFIALQTQCQAKFAAAVSLVATTASAVRSNCQRTS